jgi:hypothetical protein
MARGIDKRVPRPRMRRASSRLGFLAGSALAAITFVLVPATAYAGTTHSGTDQTAAIRVMNTRSGPATAGRSVRPNCGGTCTQAVSPRLSLAGCSAKDGFNGNIQWTSYSVQAWGEVWDSCGTTATVWLSWSCPTGHNSEIGEAAAFTTSGVNFPAYGCFTNPGNISITVCANWNGWECGTPVKV